jgi:PKHD-type hydroxylase
MNNSKLGSNLLVEPMFTVDQCNEIISTSGNWVEGTVQKFNTSMTDQKHRSVEISKKNLPEEVLEYIFEKIFHINKFSFRYHLEGYEPHDLPRVFKYSADRGDHYVWHRDTLSVPNKDSERKLSFSIQLSDPNSYKGGDLEFMPDMPGIFKRAQGNICIFPSFLTHRVSPMTEGVRHVIVGWIHGPGFK